MGVVVSTLVGIGALVLIAGVELWSDRIHPRDTR